MSGTSGIDRHGRRFDGEIRRGVPPRGTRTVSAILPNGRVVWLRVDPPLSPAIELRHVADVAEHGTRWRVAATHSNSAAIRRLAQQIAVDAEALTNARAGRAEALRRRMVARHNAIDRRVSKAAARFRTAIAEQIKVENDTVRRLRRRDLWDKIVLATALPLFAAYGQRGNPFGANNLALLISLLIWLAGDEVSDALFGSNEKSPYPVRDTDVWSYIAPIANVLAGWWLMSGLQHERFVAGSTSEFALTEAPGPAGPGELRHTYASNVNLAEVVNPGHFADFQTFADVPAVAAIQSVQFTMANARVSALAAEVNGQQPGILTITVEIVAPDPGVVPVPAVLDGLKVAWMIDTQKPESSN